MQGDFTVIWGGLVTLMIGLLMFLVGRIFRLFDMIREEMASMRKEDAKLREMIAGVQRQLDREYVPRVELAEWMKGVWHKLDEMNDKLDRWRLNGKKDG